ncbi:MAG TPA: hypothetical protein VF043_14130 [Ktedonobacteraceae bacterium]
MKYFFWIAFAVFLAASIPHVAYFFASFEPSQGPEGVWWWVVSYAIAISIDVTIYLLSWTAFQRYRRYRTPKAVWQHWLLIVMCTVFSWAVNWAYAKQFHNPTMLSSAETTAPWLTSVFPFMASAFPLLGIVYTMMAETISETEADEKQEKAQHLNALAELSRQTSLPVATLRRAITSGNRFNAASILALTNRTQAQPEAPIAVRTAEPETNPVVNIDRPITGKIVTIDSDNSQDEVHRVTTQNTNTAPVTAAIDGNPDKLQMTLEALRANPNITDEALAEYLALKRPASARFWRLKAIEILNAPGREPGGAPMGKMGKTAALRNTAALSTSAGAVNGNNNKL